MSLRRLAAALVAVVVTATPAARTQETPTKGIENFEKRFPPAEKNAAAEELEQLALLLGIDFHQDDAEAQHPSREDLDANRQAGFGSWLDAQLMVADDSIAPLPGKLRDFLDKRQRVIGRIAGLLGREAPEWAPAVRESANRIPPMFVVISLEKILFSAALVEERAGRHGQTGDLLEASWSLGRSLTKQPDLTSQLIAVAVARLQAGALRKISDPPIQWLDRMSGDEPREGILEALEDVPMLSHRGDLSLDSFTAALVRAWRAVADRVRTLSPCECRSSPPKRSGNRHRKSSRSGRRREATLNCRSRMTMHGPTSRQPFVARAALSWTES